MPIKRSSYKELRKAKHRHARNINIVSELKTSTKDFQKLLSEKKADEAKSLLKDLISKIDKAASKGVIHRNTASRKISRLTKNLSGLGKA